MLCERHTPITEWSSDGASLTVGYGVLKEDRGRLCCVTYGTYFSVVEPEDGGLDQAGSPRHLLRGEVGAPDPMVLLPILPRVLL
ncbi:hypothetical protein ACFL59_00840 [Planctomycetota bacterium]